MVERHVGQRCDGDVAVRHLPKELAGRQHGELLHSVGERRQLWRQRQWAEQPQVHVVVAGQDGRKRRSHDRQVVVVCPGAGPVADNDEPVATGADPAAGAFDVDTALDRPHLRVDAVVDDGRSPDGWERTGTRSGRTLRQMRQHVRGQYLGGGKHRVCEGQPFGVSRGTFDDCSLQVNGQCREVGVGADQVLAVDDVVGLVDHGNRQPACFGDQLDKVLAEGLAVDDQAGRQLQGVHGAGVVGWVDHLEREPQLSECLLLLLHAVVPALDWIAASDHEHHAAELGIARGDCGPRIRAAEAFFRVAAGVADHTTGTFRTRDFATAVECPPQLLLDASAAHTHSWTSIPNRCCRTAGTS